MSHIAGVIATTDRNLEKNNDDTDGSRNSAEMQKQSASSDPTIDSPSPSVASDGSISPTGHEPDHRYVNPRGVPFLDYEAMTGIKSAVSSIANLPFNPAIPFPLPGLNRTLHMQNSLDLVAPDKNTCYAKPSFIPRHYEISAVNLTSAENQTPSKGGFNLRKDVSRPQRQGTNAGTSAKAVIPGLVCLVCGDSSSGKHYGILACNGCSGFFKRSVRRRLIYRCQAGNGNCVIDKAHRNQCQACRLRKCLQMGMNKDAVQNERQPRNSATLRPEVLAEMDHERILRETAVAVGAFGTPSSFAFGLGSTPFGAERTKIGDISEPQRNTPTLFRPAITTTHALAEGKEGTGGQVAYENTPEVLHNTKSSSVLLNKELRAFPQDVTEKMQCTSCKTESFAGPDSFCHANHKSSPAGGNVESILDIAPRLLLMGVRWTKSLPGFSNLSPSDQVLLLRESWSELFLICAIQFFSFMDDSPLFSIALTNQSCDDSRMKKDLVENNFSDQFNHFAASDLRLLRKIASRFHALAVDPIEFACLKAVIVFKSHVFNLQDTTLVEKLQDHAILTLSEHIHATPPLRFGRLLLIVQLLQKIPSERVERLYFKKTKGSSIINSILNDM